MDNVMSLKDRQELYKKYNGMAITKLKKKNLLGEGVQGKVYKYCEDQGICIAVKKVYMDNKQSKYINKINSTQALKNNLFIELFSNKLINTLLIENISPNFIFFYNNHFEEREGICWEEYPYSSYFYNEYIDNAESFASWVYKNKPRICIPKRINFTPTSNGDDALKLFYNAFFQIITAIYAAQKHFGLIHLDLHAENIIVKKIKKGGYFKYILGDTEYNVPNLGYLFLINDYGFAWIPKNKKKNKEYDINFLLNDIKNHCNIKIINDIKYIIKNLKNNKISFEDLIKNIWHDMYKDTNKKDELLEIYHLDKTITLNKTITDIIIKGMNC